EIIKTAKTADWVVATAITTGIAQGKSCIVVKDGPGFYTTRILAPYLNEAVVLIEEGVSMNDIDTAMLAFGYPVGPIALLDEVGIDVGAHVTIELGQMFAARGATPSNVLPLLLSKGFKGRKNKKGFYMYDSPKKKGMRLPNEEVYTVIGKVTPKAISVEEIQQRVSLMMINEAAHCLQEGILSSPRDGDVGSVLGLGFPPFKGGIFRYIDHEGAGTIVDTMMQYYNRGLERFKPARILADMAKTDKRFYKD
ncbi:MAG TPA: 3-hydroxyacyl-CoA dehydrogenase family protein, partial [Spirochaetota bacterium]|nr:3-hydroxyacyl-CoA dehydrogenase family protein [Spirochaetota bacterium]